MRPGRGTRPTFGTALVVAALAATALAAGPAGATTTGATTTGATTSGASGASGGAVVPPTSPVTARVATYNIHAGAGTDDVYDLERTASAIRALDADVVGLEEADVHWGDRSHWEDTVAELGRRLGMRTAFAPIYSLDPPAPGQPRREFGVALLSRFPLVSIENHDLTRLSTQDPNPVPAPAPGFLEAVVQVGGARTHVYVTHLDYRGDPSVRRLQVADTLRILDEDPEGASQVLLGDLNAEASAPELAPLWTRLRDTWAVAPVRDGEPGLSYPAIGPTKRIDVVSVSPGVEVVDASTQHHPTLVPASDHRAVVATVRLPQGSESSR
jgi:endonuclease/exonuclease/phosphatase family metal-dependent hydrolase